MDQTKIKVVLYQQKIYANGTFPILIRITNKRKSRYISTGYSIKLSNWDEENNKLIEVKNRSKQGKEPLANAKAINNDIEIKVNEVIGVKQKLSIEGSRLSVSNIKQQL